MTIQKVTIEQEVRFVDIDVMGHVNNAVYFNYFEQARMKWFNHLIGDSWDWNSSGILLARNEINYRLPVLLHDKLLIDVWCSKLGTKSVDMNYEVYTIKNNEKIINADGASVLVCFDYVNKKTIEVPEIWRNRLEK